MIPGIFLSVWGVVTLNIASRGVSAAIASDNYVPRRLDSVNRTDKVI